MSAAPRVLILRAPGTNCDVESAYAFEMAGAVADRIHINRLLENPRLPADYQILCLPGGFSYGDDIAAGRILASQIEHHLRHAVEEFRTSDKLVLGICNGFQVLIKSGLLLQESENPQATLTWNESGKFEDRWVWLQTDSPHCVFLRGIERLYLPVAHAEGKFVAGSEDSLRELQSQRLSALRYTLAPGHANGSVPYPANPNGSQADIAGVCDSTGRIFGLMPHPERFVDPVQHPQWTRQPGMERGDGLAIFENAVKYFA